MRNILRHLIIPAILLTSHSSFAMGPKVPSSMSRLPEGYKHLDPKGLVPEEALVKAANRLVSYASQYPNKNYMVVIDFTQHSGNRRFFLINLRSGEVEALHTAHGSGSDIRHTGTAEDFSNISGSKMSSLGYYRTGGTYWGGNGYSMYLDGQSASNSRARSRAIVVHGADYVNPSYSKMGRSSGCPALARAVNTRVIDQIKNGALMYAWIRGTP